VADAAVPIPTIQFIPIILLEILLAEIRPRHKVPAIICRQIDAVELVVRRDDYAGAAGAWSPWQSHL
jgi:hypothetical protein